MQTFKLTEKVPNHQAEQIQKALAGGIPLDDYKSDQIITTVQATFEDGVHVEIDLNNGGHDDQSAPYLNVTWYTDEMDEIYVLDEVPEELFTTYQLDMDEQDGYDQETNYVLTLTPESGGTA